MKVQNMVPDIYYHESRDFSLIGRLFEIIFNYMKTGADVVGAPITSENATTLMVDLLMSSFGFQHTQNYTNKDLIALSSMLIDIIKNKGSKKSILKLVTLLFALEGISTTPKVTFDKNNTVVKIALDYRFKNEALLQQMLEYILPVGMIYKFTEVEQTVYPSTSVNAKVAIKPYQINESDIGKVYQTEDDMKIDEALASMPSTRSMTTLGIVVTSKNIYPSNNASDDSTEEIEEENE